MLFVQPLLLGQLPLKLFGGMVPFSLRPKLPMLLSADRSPGSDELHDPVTAHVASEESSYILDAVAGNGNYVSRRLVIQCNG